MRFTVRLPAVVGICFLAGPCWVPAAQVDNPVPSKLSHHYFRQYRATAHIAVFSLNIFSRPKVGFGFAGVEEELLPDQRDITIQFSAGSIPERAHGLNRFGFIQENVKERNHVYSEADYLGLITSNGEESFSQARAALKHKSGTTAFVAARAAMNSQTARYSIRHLALSPEYRAADAEELLKHVHAAFDRPEAGQTEHVQSLGGKGMATFLYSLREAMADPSDTLQKRFMYNGKIFNMHVEKRKDAGTGQEFRAAGLIADASSATLLTGVLHDEKTKDITNFRLWFDSSAPDLLPLRFEFRPKSYLRLVFDAVPPTAAPVRTAP